jgi:hypothetical protein
MDKKVKTQIELSIRELVQKLNDYPKSNVLMAQQRLLDAVNWLNRE